MNPDRPAGYRVRSPFPRRRTCAIVPGSPAPLEMGSQYRRTERMSDARLRHAIAFEAARLMYDRVESEYFTAKRKAAKRLCRGPVKPADLPSNAEIRDLADQARAQG